jgi:hypothetical protein
MPSGCVLDLRKLRPWNGGSRLSPSEIQEYRQTHDMLGPGCLCPMVNQDGPEFVEAAIYMVRTGHLAGQYVASCALDQCGYLGESCDNI